MKDTSLLNLLEHSADGPSSLHQVQIHCIGCHGLKMSFHGLRLSCHRFPKDRRAGLVYRHLPAYTGAIPLFLMLVVGCWLCPVSSTREEKDTVVLLDCCTGPCLPSLTFKVILGIWKRSSPSKGHLLNIPLCCNHWNTK